MDPLRGKYKKHYSEEFDIAKEALKHTKGELNWADADYQAFIFRGPDVTLVFYPHKTSAGNYHLRVRNQNSKNKEKAVALMRRLDKATGSSCTFYSKTK